MFCCLLFIQQALTGLQICAPQIWQGKEMSEVEMRMWALKLEEAELLTYLLPLPRCDLDKPIQETHLTD